ncbi:MAG: helix-turn-helix domain-containing protein [Fusicatenibacter sp.]|nr:AraC family transcriptional regulator [Fusicatenibacter sp.]
MKVVEEVLKQIPEIMVLSLHTDASGPYSLSHWHEWYEVVLITEGEIEETINNQSAYLKKNDLVVIQPFDVHSTSVLSKEASFLVLLFGISAFNLDDHNDTRSKYLDLFLEKENVETGYLLSPFPCETEVHALLEKLYQVYERREVGCHMMLKGLLYQLIAYFQKTGRFLTKDEKRDEQAKIHMICKYIEEHYKEGLTVKSLARSLGYSEAHLSRTFHDMTGHTVKGYIDYVRIKEAELLLQYEQMSVNEVACAVGYGNQNSFSRAFRRITGYCPTKFRRYRNSNSVFE